MRAFSKTSSPRGSAIDRSSNPLPLASFAQYVDPNYAGGGYDEYYGDDAPGSLNCHSPDTDWELIGVYRQEFYQYIEQISKHLW